MNNSMKKLIVITGVIFFIISASLGLPSDVTDNKKEIRSPAVDDDFPNFQDEQPTEFSIGNLLAGQAGKFFNSFLQLPSTLFKFFSGVVARQPFAKLREEVRNLNISYPK